MVYIAYKIIVYIIYIILFTPIPPKKSRFFEKYDFGIWAVRRVISLIN